MFEKVENFMQLTNEKMKNLNVIKHPLIGQNLSIIRSQKTSCEEYRVATKKIAQILFYEATKTLPVIESFVETPFETVKEYKISEDIEIIISPILRAGLAFEDIALEFLPMAKIFHVGMYSHEETLRPVWYYNKLPLNFENPEKTYIFITDPMLATGGSLLDTIKLYTEKNIPQANIKPVCIICSPEGVKNIHSHFPDIEITVAALDRTLNEKGYILPGLGDAGDRFFGTL